MTNHNSGNSAPVGRVGARGLSGLVGLGVLLALAPACGSNCLDDGFAWS